MRSRLAPGCTTRYNTASTFGKPPPHLPPPPPARSTPTAIRLNHRPPATLKIRHPHHDSFEAPFAPPIPVTHPQNNAAARPSPSQQKNLSDEDPLLITSMCTSTPPDLGHFPYVTPATYNLGKCRHLAGRHSLPRRQLATVHHLFSVVKRLQYPCAAKTAAILSRIRLLAPWSRRRAFQVGAC